MAESVSQQNFYGKDKMHCMDTLAVTKHDFNHAHNFHIALQDCMHHPSAFLSKMMGDIMYLHQALWQPNACQFVNPATKKINSHVNQKHWVVTP
jgi:hypothetical protein